MMRSLLRRDFLGAGVGALTAGRAAANIVDRICLFTDHLAGFEYKEVAAMLRQLGVSGPDLTVRPGGLVLPEKVAEDLPRASAVFRDHGLTIPMITTSITSARDPTTKAILTTAAQLGIGYYKLGYFHYRDLDRWRETLESTGGELQALVSLGKALGIRAGFHNHAGSLGGPMWDAWELLEKADPRWIGHYYDPAQAMIEGGKLGWKLGFLRLSNRLTMVAIKDFIWEKTPNGWRTRWVPLGQGMVPWKEFFGMLRRTPWPGPISLHIEYDPGGKTKNERYDKALEAAARDLRFLKEQIQA